MSSSSHSSTSRVEGAHAQLKRLLIKSTGHLFDVLQGIHVLMDKQRRQYDLGLAKAHASPLRCHRDTPEFANMLYHVAPRCLNLLLSQLKLAKSPSLDAQCRDHFTTKYGLPCAHRLAAMLYASPDGVARLTLNDIDGHWLFARPHQVSLPSSRPGLAGNLHDILDPRVVRGKGRPRGATSQVYDNSTQREPSHFEAAEQSQRAGRGICRGSGGGRTGTSRGGRGRGRGRGRGHGAIQDVEGVPSTLMNVFALNDAQHGSIADTGDA